MALSHAWFGLGSRGRGEYYGKDRKLQESIFYGELTVLLRESLIPNDPDCSSDVLKYQAMRRELLVASL